MRGADDRPKNRIRENRYSRDGSRRVRALELQFRRKGGDDLSNWFTVEALSKDSFAISEYGHWEEAHSYLLCGSERALLIDSGLGVGNIGEVVRGLTALPVTLATTHVHWDHIGGHRYFSDIAVHAAEREWLDGGFPLPLSAVRRNLCRPPCRFPAAFRVAVHRVFQGAPARAFDDGARFELGGRTIEVVHTPGHSPGHCCFYESARGELYAGDLAYLGCLDMFYPSTDPLRFRQSVARAAGLGPRRIWPGHHRLELPCDLLERICAAFDRLEARGRLFQGAGVFDFGDFQLHL